MLSQADYEEVLQMRCEFAVLRADWERTVHAYYARKFDPEQPRVAAGNPGGGQWTSDGEPGQPDNPNPNSRVAGRRGNEAQCDAQYERDIVLCRMVRTPLCYEQAMKRYAACLGGHSIPILRF